MPDLDDESPEKRVAIIGMAFRFPGADSEDEFWRLILSGRSAVRRFTEEELDAAGVPKEERESKEFVAAAGALGDVSGFDAAFFTVNGRAAAAMDPQQRLFLECAHHALENAGYGAPGPGDRIGVFAAAGYQLQPLSTYLLNNLAPEGWDPRDWASAARPALGTSADFLATRVAYLLDLTGPAVTVQTACSSGLVAVHQASQAVLSGDADLALAGAAAIAVPQISGYRRVHGSVLSGSGTCRAFDAGADGTVGGSGVAAVLLKRLDRALADGDHIHAVVRGVGITNDGARKDSYLAPSADGQRDAVLRALETAGVGADSVGYLEAHGTGTFKGDPIEFDGLSSAFRRHTDRTGFCALGAVKSTIGHLDVCAGLAGLVKAVLVLRHGVVPPLAGFTRANPLLDVAASPFLLPDRARPWPAGAHPRRAGVHALAVGGTNVHIVLEEAPRPAPRPPSVPPPGLLTVSARTGEALAKYARSWRDRLRSGEPAHLADVVTTAVAGRRHLRHRLVALGDSPQELADSLDAFLRRADGAYATGEARRAPGTLALLFGGQGTGYPGMARALYDRFPVVRDHLDTCEQAHRDAGGNSLLGPLLGTDPGPPDGIWPTGTAQPALFAWQTALAGLWEHFGVTPAVTAGHSVGEYAALCAAGALSPADGVRLASLRGEVMQRRMRPGGMLALTAGRDRADELLAAVPGLELAAVNGARNHVLAGSPDVVDAAERLARERGYGVRRLAVDRAFHTSAVDPALAELREALESVAFTPVRTAFVSSVDGVLRPAGWSPDVGYLLREAREPVRFDAVADRLGQLADPLVLEAGPGGALSGLVRGALPDVGTVVTQRRGRELRTLWAAVAALHCAGLPVDWARVRAGTGGRRIPLPVYPFQRVRYWTGPGPAVPLPYDPLGDVPGDSTGPKKERRKEDDMRDTAESLLNRVTELTARHLGCAAAEVAPDREFVELGADSFQMVGLLRDLEEQLGARVSMRELFEEAPTPASLAALLAGPAAPAAVRPAPFPAPEPAPPRFPQETADLLAQRIEVIAEGQLRILEQLARLERRVDRTGVAA
ncbi:type I polyketide synthase [Streptomyces sp. 4F14]|uniref:type I polyketide synthase n=1 Tax=Streptomyces sp. 4F14 TaxID=3394380 RepID=UPI003A853A25